MQNKKKIIINERFWNKEINTKYNRYNFKTEKKGKKNPSKYGEIIDSTGLNIY